MIDGNKIFDSHMHLLGRFKGRDETLVQFLDRYGIDRAMVTSLNKDASLNVIMSSSSIDMKDQQFLDQFVQKTQLDHEQVREVIEKDPERFIGFFWFNPRIASEEDWKLLKKYIVDFKFKGIKTQMCVDMLKVPEDLFQLAEFCIEQDIPLYVHSGTGFFYQKPYTAKDYYKLVRKYKELKCIIGHAAYSMEYCINCLRYFRDFPNVYFETSTSIPYGILTLIKVMGNHRVIFGSDAPAAQTPDIELQKIKILNLDEKTLENVLYKNFSRLVGEDE